MKTSATNELHNVFSLAVIICTRNRSRSLMRRLESMVAADRTGLELRIIIVNNSGSHANDPVISSLKGQLPIRLVDEARVGKSFALNRGLVECGNADIIAVVDDDITLDHGWFLGVRRIIPTPSRKCSWGGGMNMRLAA
jgi:glycosyltransferase involved in cell wall biosynthesis